MFEKKIPIDAVILNRLTGPITETARAVVYVSEIYRQPQYRAESHINMWQTRNDIEGNTIDLVRVTYRWATRDEETFDIQIRDHKNPRYNPIDITLELKKHLETLEPKTKMEFLEHYEM